jgi:hypothetical protein
MACSQQLSPSATRLKLPCALRCPKDVARRAALRQSASSEANPNYARGWKVNTKGHWWHGVTWRELLAFLFAHQVVSVGRHSPIPVAKGRTHWTTWSGTWSRRLCPARLGVTQSQNHAIVVAQPGCLCDADISIVPNKVRSAKCLYHWRCVLRQ